MIHWIVVKNEEEMSDRAAELLLARLAATPTMTLGLATGSTPVGMYRRLVAAYRAGHADFSQAKSFNLDEYYPIAKDDAQSYDSFMRENLFSHVNIRPENIHIPNGEASDPQAEVEAYEAALAENGYVDLQVLGIGQNGHIGFNEPADALQAATHVTALTESTVKANARFFASDADVPRHALTMGMGSILKAGEILLLATGAAKAPALRALRGDAVTCAIPATFLKLHRNVTVICDEAAYQG